MEKTLKNGALVEGFQYINVPAMGVVFQYHYAIIEGQTVIRTQRMSEDQRKANRFDFEGAKWTGTDLSPQWVREHCEAIGNQQNPLRK